MVKKNKMKGKHQILSLSFLSIITFACSLFSEPPIEVPLPTEEILPTEVFVPEPNPEPEQAEIPASGLPIGVVAEKNGILSLFDSEGYTLAEVNTLGISYAGQIDTHIAGVLGPEGRKFPVIYFSFEQNTSLLFTHAGQATTLLSIPSFSGLVGAVGEPIIAYTTAEYVDNSLASRLYLGEIQTLHALAPVLRDNNAEGWGLVALAVDVDAGQSTGVWYSKRPWGIGGDIVFEPRRTLHHLALGSGEDIEILSVDANPSAISENREWLAYTNADLGISAMTILNLITGEGFSYPLEEVGDQRGAGEASFSPSNQYIAWMEGSGWQMAEVPNFHSVIRIGDLDGNIIAQFTDTALTAVSGMNLVQRAEPVGWLDDNTLVLMVRGEHWDDVALIKIDIPSQTPSFLAQGSFIGFLYP
jgi:hypothetical protein